MALISGIYNRANEVLDEGYTDLRNTAIFTRLWRERGLVVIDPTKISEQDWPMREWVERTATEQFGKRGE